MTKYYELLNNGHRAKNLTQRRASYALVGAQLVLFQIWHVCTVCTNFYAKTKQTKKNSFQALHPRAIMDLNVISITTSRIETPPIMVLPFTTYLIQLSWKNCVRGSIHYVKPSFYIVVSVACATWWPHWASFCDDPDWYSGSRPTRWHQVSVRTSLMTPAVRFIMDCGSTARAVTDIGTTTLGRWFLALCRLSRRWHKKREVARRHTRQTLQVDWHPRHVKFKHQSYDVLSDQSDANVFGQVAQYSSRIWASPAAAITDANLPLLLLIAQIDSFSYSDSDKTRNQYNRRVHIIRTRKQPYWWSSSRKDAVHTRLLYMRNMYNI